jgi:ADP-dependent NAD(P)H-hydrate dehydratase / NAD(P)H-hydrate epimerase
MDNKTALLSVHQMSEADQLTINSGLPNTELMENAGEAVTQAIIERWPVQPAVVLCGPGNNGGDGFVVERLLRSAGWPVRAVHFHELNPASLGEATLVVDAIFGAGLTRPVTGEPKNTLDAAASKKLIIVAIDTPSGVVGDTGENIGAVQANLTVTFFRKKPGHLLLPGRTLCGEIVVKDIGISDTVFSKITPTVFENDPSLWQSSLPLISDNHNKFHRGHALIFGGFPMTGASRLAAHATARIGAGLTTIAVPENAFAVYAAGLLSIMVEPLKTSETFDELLTDLRFTGFLIGPSAGVGEHTKLRTLDILATGGPTVIDADAITSFKNSPATLFDAIKGPCVLTPHEGEFSRIFSCEGDKLRRTRQAALISGAVVILKGADTVIASPDGSTVINANAPPTLATAGAGDVLSGIVLGLLAQGMPPFLASCAAVWIHGAAAKQFGPGLIADDLPDLLPRVLANLMATSSSI